MFLGHSLTFQPLIEHDRFCSWQVPLQLDRPGWSLLLFLNVTIPEFRPHLTHESTSCEPSSLFGASESGGFHGHHPQNGNFFLYFFSDTSGDPRFAPFSKHGEPQQMNTRSEACAAEPQEACELLQKARKEQFVVCGRRPLR